MNIDKLCKSVGLTRQDCSDIFSLADPGLLLKELVKLDAKIEVAIISEIDVFTARAERDTLLIRFLSEDDFALYEPALFEQFHRASVHAAFLVRTQRAIERLGGEVTFVFMEQTFYETWLGVNDFDDSPDLRLTWARQQIRGLSN